MKEIAEEFRQFLLKNGYLTSGDTIADEDSLLDLGVIDSLAVVEITEFMRSRYQVEPNDEDLVPQNFESIEAVAGFIAGHATT